MAQKQKYFLFLLLILLGFSPILYAQNKRLEHRYRNLVNLYQKTQKTLQNTNIELLQHLKKQTSSSIRPLGVFSVTAYSEIDSCHHPNCVMASGKRAYLGAIACPRYFPLKTKILIDEILYVCEDRTSKRYPHRFDIFMGYGKNAYQKAINFGIQNKPIFYKIVK